MEKDIQEKLQTAWGLLNSLPNINLEERKFILDKISALAVLGNHEAATIMSLYYFHDGNIDESLIWSHYAVQLGAREQWRVEIERDENLDFYCLFARSDAFEFLRSENSILLEASMAFNEHIFNNPNEESLYWGIRAILAIWYKVESEERINYFRNAITVNRVLSAGNEENSEILHLVAAFLANALGESIASEIMKELY